MIFFMIKSTKQNFSFNLALNLLSANELMGGQKQLILLHPVIWLQGIKELKNPKFLNISFVQTK